MNVKYFLHIFGPKTLKGAVGVPQSGTRIWQKAIFKHTPVKKIGYTKRSIWENF